MDEEDAQLILAVMREHSEDIMEFIPALLGKFPALSKNIFYFSLHVEDKAELLAFIRDYVKDSTFVSEFQLFWLGKLCEERLMEQDGVGDVLLIPV